MITVFYRVLPVLIGKAGVYQEVQYSRGLSAAWWRRSVIASRVGELAYHGWMHISKSPLELKSLAQSIVDEKFALKLRNRGLSTAYYSIAPGCELYDLEHYLSEQSLSRN